MNAGHWHCEQCNGPVDLNLDGIQAVCEVCQSPCVHFTEETTATETPVPTVHPVLAVHPVHPSRRVSIERGHTLFDAMRAAIE